MIGEKIIETGQVLLIIAGLLAVASFSSCRTVQPIQAEKQTQALIDSGVIVGGRTLTKTDAQTILAVLKTDNATMHTQQATIEKDNEELTFFRVWGLRIGVVVLLGLLFVTFKILRFFEVLP